MTSRLIVVSNRGPYRRAGTGRSARWVRSAGGLVAALDPVLKKQGGVWLSAEEADIASDVAITPPNLGYKLHAVKVSRKLQSGFYEGVSNALLWPLLHSFPPTLNMSEVPWDDYFAANQCFANETLEVSEPEDTVWVQDYQLMLVPRMLREKHPHLRIGWFCHVPWPNVSLFQILPWRNEILEGLLGADTLGFHTREYAVDFIRCAESLSKVSVNLDDLTIEHQGRRIQVLPAPIGIDVENAQTLAADPWVRSEAARLKQILNGRRMILGVDRLDYTKGIPERIQAYEAFLRMDGSLQPNCVYVQVMVPSRINVDAYAQLKREVDRLVGDVNGRFSSTGKIPIHYLFRSLEQKLLFAHYRAADIALVTPLRDGMNLVAHEYAASRLERTGALVLSEFAGAASFFSDAILVNPYDIKQTSEAIQHALQLSAEEQNERMRSIQGQIQTMDVHQWAAYFLDALEHRRN